MRQMLASFEALGARDFRLLWSGSLLATTAFMTTFILVPIVAYELTGSYAASGFAQMGMAPAQLLLGPFGGVIADRYPKKPLVLAGQIAPCIIIIATGVLIVTDNITIPLLFGSTFLMGAAFSLMGPARQAWVVDLVPPRLLANAVALQQMSINVAAVLGPMMAAILVVTMGLDSGILYLLVASFFVIVIPLTTLLPQGAPSAESKARRGSVRSELTAGFSYLRVRPQLRDLWLFWLLIVVCGFALQTLLPGILDREFGRSPNEATVLNLVFGIAALPVNLALAGIVSGRLAWPALFGTGVLLALGTAFVGGAPTYLLLLIAAAVAGAGRSGVMLVNQAILMNNTRGEYFGRVMSWVLIAFGLQALLAPVWGVVADAIGGRQALYIVALVVVAGTALMVLSWLRTRRLLPEEGTGAAAVAAMAAATAAVEPPEEPQTAPSPAYSAHFAARLAPVVLMEKQKR